MHQKFIKKNQKIEKMKCLLNFEEKNKIIQKNLLKIKTQKKRMEKNSKKNHNQIILNNNLYIIDFTIKLFLNK